ncbi:SpoIIE family protein phosphatase, partial [Actinacidiphila acidipaludis]
ALEAVRRDAPDLIVSDVMMPGLNGLELVAELRADARTALLPVLLLSARAGQQASIEGLQSGADDYLVKPFAAAELLARVEANVKLVSLRTHHARWRSALVDSLQESFFVCDEDGAVTEINAAFTTMLGYGAEELPYRRPHPWWPDAATEPDAHRQARDAFDGLMKAARGSCTVPVRHRDGRRLWVSANLAHAQDPDSGRRVTVGTFRDVTAEHHAVQRESALGSLSTTVSRATSLADALAGALHELKDLWRAERVLAAVFEGGATPTVTATDASGWKALPPGQQQAIIDVRERPLLVAVPHAAGAGMAIEHPHGPAVLWIDLGEHRPFTEEDQVLLSLLAGHLAQGLIRAHQIDQQRETALALQRAILGPTTFPEGFAVRYEPATPPLEVGGDWYDIIPLSDGRIGVVVGDCVGHGLESATVMGQLRSACRALLLQDSSPAAVLMALDRFAVTVPRALCTTVFCGVLDQERGVLSYSSAGHPPAILARPDGTADLLEEGRSLPLAIRPGRTRPQAECVLPARATLLVYTDGLVERRRRSLDEGIEQAVRAVQHGSGAGLEELATRIMTELAPPGGYDDDVALLVYRHPGPLEVAFPADSSQLAPVRKALRGWLGQCELPRDTVQNVLVAAGEACANAIEHGHRDRPDGTVVLRAETFAHTLRLTVTDTGRWQPPQPRPSGHRGRGIILMRALMEHVTVSSGPGGTTVDMHTRIA